MERWSSSLIYPVTACTLGVAAAFAFAAVSAPIWACFAIGLSTAVGALALRNWWIGEEERPLLAEELMGLHEAVDALKAESQELRDLMSEAVEMAEYRISEDAGAPGSRAGGFGVEGGIAMPIEQSNPAAQARDDAVQAREIARLEAMLRETRRLSSERERQIERLESRLTELESKAAPSPTPFADRFEARLDAHEERTKKLIHALSFAIDATRRHGEQLRKLNPEDRTAHATERPARPVSQDEAPRATEPASLAVSETVDAVRPAPSEAPVEAVAPETRTIAPETVQQIAERMLAKRSEKSEAGAPSSAAAESKGSEEEATPPFKIRTADSSDQEARLQPASEARLQPTSEARPQPAAEARPTPAAEARPTPAAEARPKPAAEQQPTDHAGAFFGATGLSNAVLRVQPIFRAETRQLRLLEVLPEEETKADIEAGALLERALGLAESFKRQKGRLAALFAVGLAALRSDATLAPLLAQLRADPAVANMLAPSISHAEILNITDQDFALMRRLADVGVRFALRDVAGGELDPERAAEAGVRFIMLDAADVAAREQQEPGALARQSRRMAQLGVSVILTGISQPEHRELAAAADQGVLAQGFALEAPRRIRFS